MDVLGIDFGTSNTVAVLAGDGRPPRVLAIDGVGWLPSCIYIDDDGTLTVGRDAERKARLAPERFEANPKRRIDDGEILLGVRVVPVVDAIAAVLHRVIEEARRQLNGRSPDFVNLTHPAEWGASRQNVLLAAARAAGLGPSLALVPEPVAAAAHFSSLPGKALAAGTSLAVYDLGGGTFDCAVVGSTPAGFTVLAESGLADVGGVDFDQAVIDDLGRTVSAEDPARWQALARPRNAGDRRAARTLREDVTAAKETLSRYAQTDLPLPEPFDDTLLTRKEFEGLVRPVIARTVDVLADTVRRAGVSPERLGGIYLVGGSSRIPLVAGMIGERLGVVPTTLDQPETAVAMGAALIPPRSAPYGRTEQVGGPRTPVPPSPPWDARTGRGYPPTAVGMPAQGDSRQSPSGPGAPGRPSSGPGTPGPGAPGQGSSGQGGPGGYQQQGPAFGTGQFGHGPGGPRAGVPGTGGPGQMSSGAPRTPPAGNSGRTRILLIAAAVVAILAIGTVVVLTTRSSSATADPRTTAPSTSGTTSRIESTSTHSSSTTSQSSTTSSTPTTPTTPTTSRTTSSSRTTTSTSSTHTTSRTSQLDPAKCSSVADASGVTSCMAAVIGSIGDLDCSQDPSRLDLDATTVAEIQAVTTSWSTCIDNDKGYAAVVFQATGAPGRDTLWPLVEQQFKASRSGTWKSGQNSGAYSAGLSSSGVALVGWKDTTLPVLAFIGASSGESVDDVVAYWKSALKATTTG